MSNSSERRAGQRFKYTQDATIVTSSGAKLKAHIQSISKSGVLLSTYQEFEVNTILILGWKDQGNVIKGQFLVKGKQPSKDGQMWMYGVRFYKMDDASKNHTRALLKRLSLPPKEDTGELGVELIKKTIAQGPAVFNALLDEQTPIDPLLRSKLENIDADERKAIFKPQNEFEQTLSQLHLLDIHAHLILGFLHRDEKLVFEDLQYCLSAIRVLFDQYISATAKDHALPEKESLEDKNEDEVQVIEAAYEKRVNMQRSYNGLSNQVYESCTHLTRYFTNEEWIAKADDLEQSQINEMKLAGASLAEKYKASIQVTIDKVSDVDAILTRSYYEVENNPENQEKAQKEVKHQSVKAYKSHLKKIALLSLLIPAFFINLWIQTGTKNIKSQYEDQLQLPIKIRKIDREGSQMQIYINQNVWNQVDDATKEEIDQKIETFLKGQSNFTGVIGYVLPGGVAFIKYKWD